MLQKTHLAKKVPIMAIIALALSSQSFITKKSKMKIQANQPAPTFTINDVNGAKINLPDYRGKKLLLLFNRNVGCPICNLQYHNLNTNADYFKKKGVVILSVYESSAENMKTYLDGETSSLTMIPDPTLSLYKLYAVERSNGKILKGLFNGALGKARAGKKIFTKKMKQDGNSDRINAEFLIDENGKVTMAHYGNYLGDDLSIEEIKKMVE